MQILNRVMSASARLIDSPRAREIYSQLRQGVRRGASPAFLVNDFIMVDGPDGEPGFDITSYMIFEISLTGVPRNPASRLTAMRGQFALGGGKAMTTVKDLSHGPDVVNLDDLDGLSLSLGRKALRDGRGTDQQQARLSSFYRVYDEAAATGRPRNECIQIAKSKADLP